MSEHQETSPRFDKKLKLYAAGTFGAIALLFLVLFLTEKMRAKPETSTPSSVPPVAESAQPTDLTARTFESVRDTRARADDTFVAAKQEGMTDRVRPTPTQTDTEGVAREKAQQEALEYK
ncbi:conjugal transfer protein, partial [Vibrio vulnificus]|nr:conjugal transfer protein [Vibrio vulnificus]